MFNSELCPYDLCGYSTSRWSPPGLCSSTHWPLESRAWYKLLLLQTISSFTSFETLGSKWQLPAPLVCQKIQFPSSPCLLSPVWNSSTANLRNVSSIFPTNSDTALVQRTGVSGCPAGIEPSHVSCLEGLCCSLWSCNMVELNSF